MKTQDIERSRTEAGEGREWEALGGVLWAFTRAVARLRGVKEAEAEPPGAAPPQPAAPPTPVAPLTPVSAGRDRSGEPRTLRQLGVPGELAMDLEQAFAALGAVQGNRVVGFSFRPEGGPRHPLVVEEPREAGERAA